MLQDLMRTNPNINPRRIGVDSPMTQDTTVWMKKGSVYTIGSGVLEEEAEGVQVDKSLASLSPKHVVIEWREFNPSPFVTVPGENGVAIVSAKDAQNPNGKAVALPKGEGMSLAKGDTMYFSPVPSDKEGISTQLVLTIGENRNMFFSHRELNKEEVARYTKLQQEGAEMFQVESEKHEVKITEARKEADLVNLERINPDGTGPWFVLPRPLPGGEVLIGRDDPSWNSFATVGMSKKDAVVLFNGVQGLLESMTATSRGDNIAVTHQEGEIYVRTTKGRYVPSVFRGGEPEMFDTEKPKILDPGDFIIFPKPKEHKTTVALQFGSSVQAGERARLVIVDPSNIQKLERMRMEVRRPPIRTEFNLYSASVPLPESSQTIVIGDRRTVALADNETAYRLDSRDPNIELLSQDNTALRRAPDGRLLLQPRGATCYLITPPDARMKVVYATAKDEDNRDSWFVVPPGSKIFFGYKNEGSSTFDWTTSADVPLDVSTIGALELKTTIPSGKDKEMLQRFKEVLGTAHAYPSNPQLRLEQYEDIRPGTKRLANV